MDKSYQQDYYQEHKQEIKEYHKAWYLKNKERLQKKNSQYVRDNKDRLNKIRKNYPSYGHPHYVKGRAGNSRVPDPQYKLAILEHYGKKCKCCSEECIALLTVDHENDNGIEHKRNGKNRYKGQDLYRHLIRLGYPDGIQILCFNCNIGRRNNKGICPHNSINPI